MNPQEKSRGLLHKIVRRNIACTIFLEVLKEDSKYKEYAIKIEETVVTQLELDLLRIGRYYHTIFLYHYQKESIRLCNMFLYCIPALEKSRIGQKCNKCE